MLVFEKIAIYLHGEVQPQRKSRLITHEIIRSRDAQCNTGESVALNQDRSIRRSRTSSVRIPFRQFKLRAYRVFFFWIPVSFLECGSWWLDVLSSVNVNVTCHRGYRTGRTLKVISLWISFMESLEHDWHLAKARVTRRSQGNGRVTNMAN